MTVTLDGQLLSPDDGFLLRKGPGNCYFDFAQQILFSAGQNLKPDHATCPAARQQPASTNSQ